MTAQLKERDIEKYFVAEVEKAGGEVRKMCWINRKDAPDRFVALNGAHVIELKAPGEEPRPSQKREHERLRAQGVKVWVLDTFDKVDNFIKEIS